MWKSAAKSIITSAGVTSSVAAWDFIVAQANGLPDIGVGITEVAKYGFLGVLVWVLLHAGLRSYEKLYDKAEHRLQEFIIASDKREAYLQERISILQTELINTVASNRDAMNDFREALKIMAAKMPNASRER